MSGAMPARTGSAESVSGALPRAPPTHGRPGGSVAALTSRRQERAAPARRGTGSRPGPARRPRPRATCWHAEARAGGPIRDRNPHGYHPGVPSSWERQMTRKTIILIWARGGHARRCRGDCAPGPRHAPRRPGRAGRHGARGPPRRRPPSAGPLLPADPPRGWSRRLPPGWGRSRSPACTRRPGVRPPAFGVVTPGEAQGDDEPGGAGMTGRPRPRAATTGTEAPARPAVLVLDAGDFGPRRTPALLRIPCEVPVRSLAPAARVRPGAVRGVRLPAGPNVVPFPPRTSHSSSRNRCTRSAPGRSTRRLEQVAVRFALARIAPAASRSRTRPLQSSQAFISDRSGSTPGAPPRTVRRARPRCSPARAAGTGRDRSARERLDADGAVAGPRRVRARRQVFPRSPPAFASESRQDPGAVITLPSTTNWSGSPSSGRRPAGDNNLRADRRRLQPASRANRRRALPPHRRDPLPHGLGPCQIDHIWDRDRISPFRA